MNVFQHHDRIIYHQPDRKNQCQKRQQVDTVSGKSQHDKRSDQRDGYRKCGDQRGAEIPEEQEDDQQHENGGDDQRFDHFINCRLNEQRIVPQNFHLHIIGQVGTDLFRQFLCAENHTQRIGSRLLGNTDRDHGFFV